MSVLNEITEKELERLQSLSTDLFGVPTDSYGGTRWLRCSHEVREHVRQLTNDNERMRMALRVIIRFVEFCKPSAALEEIEKLAREGLGEEGGAA
ncbi:MAG: hypothetical protein JXQ29_16395 [Planctomycetes bacterium]|nr:hypothetical protein [Planctomycetota bacterium]